MKVVDPNIASTVARPESPLSLAYLTSGAAGMFCGSCLNDNTLARALGKLGVDVRLIPTYTPIRTDEKDVTIDRVFFGGITVFMQQKIPLFRHLPRFVTRLLDQPWLIRWATSRGIQTDYQDLGALTVSMLRGEQGFQRGEVDRLCDWLAGSARPDLLNFSNILIGGCIPAIRKRLGVPVLVTLQGDDIFLESLPEPYRSQALAEIRRLAPYVDGFLTNSRYYAEHMGRWFGIPAEKLHVVPLGIDVGDFETLDEPKAAGDSPLEKDRHENGPIANGRADRPLRLGYFARLAPEKGLHLLVDAFIALRRRPGLENLELHVAGWQGDHHREFVAQQQEKLQAAGLSDAVHLKGEVDRRGKIEFLRGLDLFSVPTTYHDPKGLFVLEALAAGVPVVQPDHGAFPELLERTGGGRLFRSGDASALVETLAELLLDSAERRRLANEGRRRVHAACHSAAAAAETLAVMRRFVPV